MRRSRVAGRLSARSCQRDSQCLHCIVNRNGRLAIVAQVVYKVLKLGRVRVPETFHEKWNGVVRDLIPGHHEKRRLAEVSDSQRARGAEDFAEDVIAVDAAAAE